MFLNNGAFGAFFPQTFFLKITFSGCSNGLAPHRTLFLASVKRGTTKRGDWSR